MEFFLWLNIPRDSEFPSMDEKPLLWTFQLICGIGKIVFLIEYWWSKSLMKQKYFWIFSDKFFENFSRDFFIRKSFFYTFLMKLWIAEILISPQTMENHLQIEFRENFRILQTLWMVTNDFSWKFNKIFKFLPTKSSFFFLLNWNRLPNQPIPLENTLISKIKIQKKVNWNGWSLKNHIADWINSILINFYFHFWFIQFFVWLVC